jgi:hypothetical protein
LARRLHNLQLEELDMKKWAGLVITALTAVSMLSLLLRDASAQSLEVRYDPISKTVNLDADNADIRQVVRQLATAMGARYSMATGINANITLKLRNVAVTNALQTALARAGAEYEMKDGFIRVFKVGTGSEPDRPSPGGGSIPPRFLQRVGLSMNDSPLPTVMATLSRQTGLRITASQQTPKDLRVSVTASNEPLWNVLQYVARRLNLKVEVTGDTEATFGPLLSNGNGGNCRNCKYELKREWRYCPMCGERIGR